MTRNLGYMYVYYEEIKREVNRRLIYECRFDERPKGNADVGSYHFLKPCFQTTFSMTENV
jgi:hypothetical protein